MNLLFSENGIHLLINFLLTLLKFYCHIPEISPPLKLLVLVSPLLLDVHGLAQGSKSHKISLEYKLELQKQEQYKKGDLKIKKFQINATYEVKHCFYSLTYFLKFAK